MQFIGRISFRKIYYLAVREHPGWRQKLPRKAWVGYVFATENNEEMIPFVARTCLDRQVAFVGCGGHFAHRVAGYFEEEMDWGRIGENPSNSIFPDIKAHPDLKDGLKFAAKLALKDDYEVEKVVILDLTARGNPGIFAEVLKKINAGTD